MSGSRKKMEAAAQTTETIQATVLRLKEAISAMRSSLRSPRRKTPAACWSVVGIAEFFSRIVLELAADETADLRSRGSRLDHIGVRERASGRRRSRRAVFSHVRHCRRW